MLTGYAVKPAYVQYDECAAETSTFRATVA